LQRAAVDEAPFDDRRFWKGAHGEDGGKAGGIVKVADILARKGSAVITIKPSETIGTLSRLLREKRIGVAIVSSDGQTIDGVISERDIAYGLAIHKADLHTLPVSALMTKTVVTCSLNDNIGLVASTMLSRNIRHLPVEEKNCVVGMVSIRDVLNLRLDELQQETAQLRTFVSVTGDAPQDRE
jgi:CBS domain-containing protein